MRTLPQVPTRDVVLFRALARTLFAAKSEREVADALLATASAVQPHGGAVYVERGGRFRRAAATGTGLALPAETDELRRAGLTVHRHGSCALVHDALDAASESLLADAVALAGAALDEVAAKEALRARSRSMADHAAVADERAASLAQTVVQALVEAIREMLKCSVAEILLLEEHRATLVGIPRWVIENGAPALVPDASADPRYHARHTATRSQLCVPLRLDGNVVGALNAEADAVGHFGEAHLRFLSRIQEPVAIAAALAHRISRT